MPIFRPRKFTFFPFLKLFKRLESIDMTPCVISFLVYFLFYFFLGGGQGGSVGLCVCVGGGQSVCERRSEGFVKIQKGRYDQGLGLGRAFPQIYLSNFSLHVMTCKRTRHYMSLHLFQA